LTDGGAYTNLNDLKAVVTASHSGGEFVFDAQGLLLNQSRQPARGGEMRYHIIYRISESGIEIAASASGDIPASAPLKLIVPVIARDAERVEPVDAQTVHVIKAKGTLTLHTDAADGFDAGFKEKTFNLVPGFEAFPFAVAMVVGKGAQIRLEAI
jgi:hypothetical protein